MDANPSLDGIAERAPLNRDARQSALWIIAVTLLIAGTGLMLV